MPKVITQRLIYFSQFLNNRDNWRILVILCYGSIIFFGALHHESWRDEAQAWLLARDLSPVMLLKSINYEGTPALWHFILMPFAKAGFPYESIKFIHITISFVTALIILFKAPFPPLTKIVFLFSYYMAWEYAIIARHYTLTLLLLFSIASIYEKRFTNPLPYSLLIFLLFNTNVHSLFLATGLIGLYFYDCKKTKRITRNYMLPIFLMSLGGLVAIFQLIPAEDNMSSSLLSWPPPYQNGLFKAIINAFFPVSHLMGYQLSPFPIFTYTILGLFGGFILVVSCLYLFNQSRQVLLLYLFSISWLFYLFLFRHPGQYRHHGFIVVFLIFSIWIGSYYRPKIEKTTLFSIKRTMLLLNISFSFSIFPNALMYFNDYKLEYSGSKLMATFLATQKLTDHLLIGSNSPAVSSLAPYLPKKKFWYPDIQNFGTYVVWNTKYFVNADIKFKELEGRIKGNHLNNETALLVLNTPIPEGDELNYHLLYKVDHNVFGVDDEHFFLYQKKEGKLKISLPR